MRDLVLVPFENFSFTTAGIITGGLPPLELVAVTEVSLRSMFCGNFKIHLVNMAPARNMRLTGHVAQIT
jgi:hypothetical protein